MGLGDDVTLDRLCYCLFHELLVVMQHECQDIGHLPITAVTFTQDRPQALEALWQLGKASRFSQLNKVSANGSSLLTVFLAGYLGDLSPFARYFLIVFLESPVRLVISRIGSWSRWCQRLITLNKSTSITP